MTSIQSSFSHGLVCSHQILCLTVILIRNHTHRWKIANARTENNIHGMELLLRTDRISSTATLRLAILDTALIYQYRTRLIIRLPLVSVIVSTGRTDKWVISRLLSVWTGPHHSSNLAAVCASIYHTIHTLTLTLKLTLNLALISSYLMN